MRLSIRLHCPLHWVLEWPTWVLDTYQGFLAREPVVEERLENAIAQLSAMYFNRGRGDHSPKSLQDFLMFRDGWLEREAEQLILEEMESGNET